MQSEGRTGGRTRGRRRKMRWKKETMGTKVISFCIQTHSVFPSSSFFFGKRIIVLLHSVCSLHESLPEWRRVLFMKTATEENNDQELEWDERGRNTLESVRHWLKILALLQLNDHDLSFKPLQFNHHVILVKAPPVESQDESRRAWVQVIETISKAIFISTHAIVCNWKEGKMRSTVD